MYIEMTTFAVPTFLLTLGKIVACAIAGWLVVVTIGLTIYWFTEGKK